MVPLETFIMKSSFFATLLLTLLCVTGCFHANTAVAVPEPQITDARNLLVNSEFNFHSLIPHRYGKATSYVADYVPFWNADSAKSLRVLRDSHIPVKYLPSFSVPCGVELNPGQSFHQFFTLPEAGLLYGDKVSLNFYGYQSTPNTLVGEIRAMKIESADGTWSPGKDFKFRDQRTFAKMARGELVVASSAAATSATVKKNIAFKIENFVIPGNFTPGKKSFSKDNNTVGIEVRFTNKSKKDKVWVFAPSLLRGAKAFRAIGTYRQIPEYYRHIPRTMQKLWKGEPIHILLMGSSIDRGSANPPLYPYDENPKSPKYKQPLSDSHSGFSTKVVGRPDLEPYFAWSNHYFSYAGRLKVELMKKFDLTGDKILMNFMACDGSCVGEAHSGLKQYCELLIPPTPGMNAHVSGKTWKELYPGLFSRPEGPRPDLVIFGSGANEKTDTPDECAVFEGMIRYIQRNYPGVEFLGCMYQNKGGYTPNPADMQALAMRYQFPFVDFGIVNDRLTRLINPNAIGNNDGHPQAAVHYIWFKQLERAFECAGPVVSGFPQLHLPERVMKTSYNWEGEMASYRAGSKRFFRPNAIIIDDSAFNCWATSAVKAPKGKAPKRGVTYVDGIVKSGQWGNRSYPYINPRNSFFRHGRLSFGDRHVVELSKDYKFTGLDAKISPKRYYTGVESKLFKGITKVLPYKSLTGFPYGRFITVLKPGEKVQIDLAGNGFSVAWVDSPKGGILQAEVDGKKYFETATDMPYVTQTKEKIFMENRKGISGLPYGVHTVTLKAVKAPVTIMGVFAYDMRSNSSWQKVIHGTADNSEFKFQPAFNAVPLIDCRGTLKVKSVTPEKAVFSGSGTFTAAGE